MGLSAAYSDALRTPRVEINVLNLVDPDVRNIEKNLQKKFGQKILKYGGMSNGVGQMVSDIRSAAQPNSVTVLRIWSHGQVGGQGVSLFPGVNPKGQRAGISLSNFDQVGRDLSLLKPCFAVGGRVELRGCNVSAGYDGMDLLKTLAKMFQVDVYAALHAQNIGPLDWNGPVMKVTPQGNSSVGTGPAIQ